MSFGEPDQVKFILLAFAQAELGIAVGPQFTLRYILQASYPPA